MPENLEHLRRSSAAALGLAHFDLRMTAARIAPTDVISGLRLALLATRVNKASGHGLLSLREGPASPEAPDSWLLAAARLHDAVSDAADILINLLMEAEGTRHVVVPAPDAKVDVIDGALFGFLPDETAFEGWTNPQASWDLGRLILPVGSPAWRRRIHILKAVDGWTEEHQTAVDRAGVVPLRDCCAELHGILVEIRRAVRQVRPGTVAASRAVARIAARSLIERGDDPRDLVKVAHEYAGLQEPNEPSILAWHAVEGLLVVSRDAAPAREPEEI